MLFVVAAPAKNNKRIFSIQKDSCTTLACYVKNREAIPLSFIRSNTRIDSVYLREHTFFKGDTTYVLNENYAAMILDYSDGLVCSYQFILIVNTKTNVNTDVVIGKTECIRDGENEYYSYSFEIKDGIIKVVQKHVEEGEDEQKISHTSRYVMTGEGKLKVKK